MSLAVALGGGGMVGEVVFWTGVLLAQAFNNNEDNKAAKVSSLKLRFNFILSILLTTGTGKYG
jgi:hypothetical protein